MEEISNMSDRELLEAIYKKVANNAPKNNSTYATKKRYSSGGFKNDSSETREGTICDLQKKEGTKGVFAIFALQCDKEEVECKAFDAKVVRALEEGLVISGKGHFSEWKGKEDFIVNEIEIIGQDAEENGTNTDSEIEDEDVPF